MPESEGPTEETRQVGNDRRTTLRFCDNFYWQLSCRTNRNPRASDFRYRKGFCYCMLRNRRRFRTKVCLSPCCTRLLTNLLTAKVMLFQCLYIVVHTSARMDKRNETTDVNVHYLTLSPSRERGG